MQVTDIIRRVFLPPHSDDPEQRRTAHALHYILWGFIGLAGVVTLGALLTNTNTQRFLFLGSTVVIVSGLLLALNQRGQTQLASTLLSAAFWMIATGAMYSAGGIRASMLMAYIVIIFFTGLLKGGRAGVLMALVCTLSGLGLVWIEMGGRLPPSAIVASPLSYWLVGTFFCWVVAIIQYLSARALREAFDRARAELTERRHTEAAYRALVENSLQGLVVVQGRRLVFANAAAADMTGRSVDELLALTPAELRGLLHPDDREAVVAAIRRRLRGQALPVKSEFRFIRRNGQVRWAESYIAPVDYRGRPALQVACLDITERKQAEAALRESEQLYRRAIEAADAVPYYEDYGAQRYTFMGAGIQALTGYSADEMTPALWASIVEEQTLLGEAARYGSVEAAAAAARRGEFRVWKVDSLLHTRDGRVRWVLDSAVEVTDSTGAVVGSIGILQDITARKEIEFALATQAGEISKLYRASARLLTASPNLRELGQQIADIVTDEFGLPECGLWLIRDDGLALTRLAYSGYALGYVASDIRLDGPGLITAAVHTGETVYAPDVRLDPRYLAGDDATRSELVAPLRVGQRSIGALNMESPELDAFSERDRRVLTAFAERAALAIENARLLASLEQAVRQSKQLADASAEASRIKSQFLTNTSHELRTPLTSIIGALDIVLNDLCSTRDEERQLLRTAAEAAQNLSAIVDDLLEIAKIESGGLQLHTQITALGPLLAEVQALYGPQAERKNIALHLDAPDLTHLLYADPDKLRRILLNLVGNAVKFTDEGRVTIHVRAEPTRGEMVIHIADTGIGVPLEVQGRLFQPFVQADGGHARRYGGNGLGLSIARRLAEMMGGSLTLYSPGLGHGTTLTLRLPLAEMKE